MKYSFKRFILCIVLLLLFIFVICSIFATISRRDAFRKKSFLIQSKEIKKSCIETRRVVSLIENDDIHRAKELNDNLSYTLSYNHIYKYYCLTLISIKMNDDIQAKYYLEHSPLLNEKHDFCKMIFVESDLTIEDAESEYYYCNSVKSKMKELVKIIDRKNFVK